MTKRLNLKSLLLGALWLAPLALPFFVKNEYYVHGILGRIFIYSILVASLDLVVGFIGDISIGHAGLFAIGSYTVAILTAPPHMNTTATMMFMPQVPFFIALALGIILAAFAGFILGFPALRSSGPYLAVTTIAYGLIIYTIINEQESLTNGTKGIVVKAVSVLGLNLDGNRFIWLVYPALLLVMWIVRSLARSFWGRAFEAIKYSSIAAEACGVWRSYYKIAGFVISAGIAGLAGGLFVQLDQYVAASTFNLDFSILALIALIFGGLRSPLGNVIGMALVVILPDLFSWFKDYRLMVFGILLLLTLFFLPEGVAGWLRSLWRRLDGRAESVRREQDIADLESGALNDHSPLFELNRRESQSHAALELDQVRMTFGGLTAVTNLTLQIRPGTVHGLMGPNGSGKSTTVNLITGIYQPTAGMIRHFGREVQNLKPHQRAQLGIARTFQNLQLFGDLTALENVLVGLHLKFQSNLFQVMIGWPTVEREEQKHRIKAYRLLKFVGLEKFTLEKAKNLSYGQARRLEIARALAQNPQLLLLDEPAAGLTSSEIEEMNQMIFSIKQHGLSVLLIEHHMDMLMTVSDEITVLDFGKKISEGTPEKVQNDPVVLSAYLGTTPPAAIAKGDKL
jgi:branched-chain amino acid transport system permease protein